MIRFRYNQTPNGILIQTVGMAKFMEFNCSIEAFEKGLENYKNGDLIQNAFPFLSADEREFLITGLLPEEFDNLFTNE